MTTTMTVSYDETIELLHTYTLVEHSPQQYYELLIIHTNIYIYMHIYKECT